MKQYVLDKMTNKVVVNCASMIVADGNESGLQEVTNDNRYKSLVESLTAMNNALQAEDLSQLREKRDEALKSRNTLFIKLYRFLKGKCDSLDKTEEANAQKLYQRISSFGLYFTKQSRADQAVNIESVIEILKSEDVADLVAAMSLNDLTVQLESAADLADKLYREVRDCDRNYRETNTTSDLRITLEKDMMTFETWVASQAVVTERAEWIALQKQVNDRYEVAARTLTPAKSAKAASATTTSASPATGNGESSTTKTA